MRYIRNVIIVIKCQFRQFYKLYTPLTVPVKEVNNNYECGIGLEKYNDIKPGDIIEAYEIKEIKTTL